ncbi:sulfatase [Leptospira sp. 96542]|nr:sulfatase [Leptospira sp. 96542]
MSNRKRLVWNQFRFLSKLFIFFSLFHIVFCQKPEEKSLNSISEKTNVIWVVIDSLRGDVIGNYNVTPNLESFAKEAYDFQYHLVNAAWTRPSTLVFFTGRFASRNPVNFWDYPTPKSEALAFYKEVKKPLPRYLQKHGYQTMMVGNNPFLTEKNGLGVNVGFEQLFDYSRESDDTKKITRASLKTLESRRKDKPFFLFINYNDPHKPYTPPPGFTERVKTKEVLDERKLNYLGEVAFVDEELGKIFKHLKNNQLWDNTLIIITADHGEVMNEAHAISPFTGTNTHYGHGQDLFLENIHVPLLIKFPDKKDPKTITAMTRSVDLYPTVLDELKLPIPTDLDGLTLSEFKLNSLLENTTKRTYYGETRSTQCYGEGREFLLQRSFRFHEVGQFWQGGVGNEFYLYGDSEKDPHQENLIRINRMDLLDTEPLEADVKKRIRFLWEKLRSLEPKLPLYFVKVKIPNGNIEVKITAPYGKIRIDSESENGKIKDLGRTVVWLGRPKKDLLLSFEVYPDVSFPVLEVRVNQKQVPKSEIRVGSFGVTMDSCSINCELLYEASFGKPSDDPTAYVQFWKVGGQNKSYTKQDSLGTDALDILKKQGYVQ